MAKTKQQKEKTLTDLVQSLKNAKAVVFTSFSGLKVKDAEELRRELRQNNIKYEVVKKTLLKLAAKKAEMDDIQGLDGNISVALSETDEVEPARLVYKFSLANKAMTIIGGALNKKVIKAEEVKMLAKLPGKQELIAKVVGTVKAPISGFVGVMKGNLRGLVGALNAIKDKKQA